jgi:hypothetical protein
MEVLDVFLNRFLALRLFKIFPDFKYPGNVMAVKFGGGVIHEPMNLFVIFSGVINASLNMFVYFRHNYLLIGKNWLC